MNKINLFSIPNDNYVQHLCVLLASLQDNISSDVDYYILDNSISGDNKKLIEQTITHPKLRVIFLSLHDVETTYGEAPTSGHITKEAYYRLSIPELVQDFKLSKVVYLDCDLVITKDIKQLWEINLNGKALGAVVNLNGENRLRDLEIELKYNYFNSGVLVFNISKWIEEDYTSKILQYIKLNSSKLLLHDQDAMNAILFADWKDLGFEWNLQTRMLEPGNASSKVIKNAGIVHFTGAIKPWHYNSHHPFRGVYFKYLHLTPFKDFKIKKSFILILKRMLRR